MKKALKILLPLFLSLVILISLLWYFLIYDRVLSRDLLLTGARISDDAGYSTLSAWFYNQAYNLSDNSGDSVVVELAEQYRRSGNYTKAEYTLTNAISNGGGVEIYTALCKVYVEQNKLYDAVTLLDSVSNPDIKAELDKIRPKAPQSTPDQGLYNQYISVSFQAPTGTIYTALGSGYPSLNSKPYSKPIPLSDGENIITALAVSDDGIVSPLTTGIYTIGGVVESLDFTDRFIEATIRDLLNIEKKQLYTNDLWKLTEFTVPSEATSYDELVHMKNLQKLTVENGAPEELTCLKAMAGLTALTIRNTEVSDEVLEIIGSLTKLETLILQDCKISNISALKSLSNIRILDLSNNTIYDLTALSGMTNLSELYIKNNVVDDLSALANLQAMVKLDVSDNKLISTLAPLSNLTKLVWLDAGTNSITELGNIGNLQSLSSLSLVSNNLMDISSLAGCSALTDLNLSKNQISDISALSSLSKLMYLRFRENQVSELPAFAKDAALVIIDGTGNNIQSLEPLRGLQDLNNVYMNNNSELASVSPLADCHRLVEVHVDNTRVTDVSALDEGVIVKYTPI